MTNVLFDVQGVCLLTSICHAVIMVGRNAGRQTLDVFLLVTTDAVPSHISSTSSRQFLKNGNAEQQSM